MSQHIFLDTLNNIYIYLLYVSYLFIAQVFVYHTYGKKSDYKMLKTLQDTTYRNNHTM